MTNENLTDRIGAVLIILNEERLNDLQGSDMFTILKEHKDRKHEYFPEHEFKNIDMLLNPNFSIYVSSVKNPMEIIAYANTAETFENDTEYEVSLGGYMSLKSKPKLNTSEFIDFNQDEFINLITTRGYHKISKLQSYKVSEPWE